MNYELAKKLKESGFPQRSNENCEDPYVCCLHTDEKNAVTWPTLSELIEACGQDFEELVFTDAYNEKSGVKTKWRAFMSEEAFAKTGVDCVWDCDGYKIGDTPEEAVANLWLALKEPVPTKIE